MPAWLVTSAGHVPICFWMASVLSFLDATKTPEVHWLNAPEAAAQEGRAGAIDPGTPLPALRAPVTASGAARIEFTPSGEYVVEIFVLVRDEARESFVLEADGQLVDDRLRLRTAEPRQRPRRPRLHSLLGVVEGPVTLTLRSSAAEYGLSGIRWTPRAEFEKESVPALLALARRTHADINEPRVIGDRQSTLRYLSERLTISSGEAVRREGLLGLTRAYYWAAAENHEPNDLARLGELLQQCLRQMPGDALVRQMASASCAGTNVGAGRGMARGRYCEAVAGVTWEAPGGAAPAGAPDWAAAQRRLKRRLNAITRWWVDERQLPNGELGGGWGDDVEMLRNWGPLALGLGSTVAAKGLERVADGLWNSGEIEHGYDRRISDVEHSSEPTTDTLPLLAALRPDDPKVVARLAETAACAQYWIGAQPDGHYRFHSSWFNCREHDARPGRDVDVHLNVRAMGPALWYAYLTRDADTIARLWHWGESWLSAMRSTAHGKPAGIIPSAVSARDGNYLIGSQRWDRPSVEWDYFQWSGTSQAALTTLFLALHDLTAPANGRGAWRPGESKWLDAAGETFAAANEEFAKAPEAFFEWRRRVSIDRHDARFGWKPAPAGEQILAAMTRDAKEMEERTASNFDMWTREVLYTDRVYYSLAPGYARYLFGGEAPRGERYPFFAVTWEPSDDEYARAVLEAGTDSLRLRFYNFETRPVTANFRAWRLRPGKYRWRMAPGEGRGEFTVDKRPHWAGIALPPRREVAVEIERR